MDFPTTEGWVDVRDGLPLPSVTVAVAVVDVTTGQFEDVENGHLVVDEWVVYSSWFGSEARRVIAWRPIPSPITQKELDDARAKRLSAAAVFNDQFGV